MSAYRPHPQVGSDYTVSNRQCLGPHTVKQAFLHSLLQCSVQNNGSVLKLLRTGTLALPFEVGPANNTRGFRSADGPHPQMCFFGGSADRPRPQENQRIWVRGYPRPQFAHLWWLALPTADISSTIVKRSMSTNVDTLSTCSRFSDSVVGFTGQKTQPTASKYHVISHLPMLRPRWAMSHVPITCTCTVQMAARYSVASSPSFRSLGNPQCAE